MSHDPSTVEVSVDYIHETDRAVLVSDGDEKRWVPKSQLVAFQEYVHEKGEPIEIYVSEWFATQHDMI